MKPALTLGDLINDSLGSVKQQSTKKEVFFFSYHFHLKQSRFRTISISNNPVFVQFPSQTILFCTKSISNYLIFLSFISSFICFHLLSNHFHLKYLLYNTTFISCGNLAANYNDATKLEHKSYNQAKVPPSSKQIGSLLVNASKLCKIFQIGRRRKWMISSNVQ